MKMRQIAIAFLFVSAAQASGFKQNTQGFIIKADPIETRCGLEVTNNSASLNEEFKYTVIGPNNNLDAFVNITDWNAHSQNLNPNYVRLENIGYNFGTYGRPVEFVAGNPKKEMTFSVVKRPNSPLPPGLQDTDLVMTLTCFDAENDDYLDAKRFWHHAGGTNNLRTFNLTTFWRDGFGITKGYYPMSDTKKSSLEVDEPYFPKDDPTLQVELDYKKIIDKDRNEGKDLSSVDIDFNWIKLQQKLTPNPLVGQIKQDIKEINNFIISQNVN